MQKPTALILTNCALERQTSRFSAAVGQEAIQSHGFLTKVLMALLSMESTPMLCT